jgi:4'-phosphopantetheinyl transferase
MKSAFDEAAPAFAHRERGSADLPSLDRHSVHVWGTDLDAQPAHTATALLRTLAPDEQVRADSFHFDRDRHRYVIARGTLRQLLGAYLGCEPEAVRFAYGPHGKPMLRTPADDERRRGQAMLRFNVAHADALALFAVSTDGDVGVDVERVRTLPDWEQVGAAVFAPGELTQVRMASRDEQCREFFRIWTRREALLKALGVGLGGAVRIDAAPGFELHDLHPGSGYVAALAVPSSVAWLTTGWCEPGAGAGAPMAMSRLQRIRLGDPAATAVTFA